MFPHDKLTAISQGNMSIEMQCTGFKNRETTLIQMIFCAVDGHSILIKYISFQLYSWHPGETNLK